MLGKPIRFADWAGEYRTENSDLEPGRCIVCGTDQGLHARCSRLEDPVFRMVRCWTAQRLLGVPLDSIAKYRLLQLMTATPNNSK